MACRPPVIVASANRCTANRVRCGYCFAQCRMSPIARARSIKRAQHTTVYIQQCGCCSLRSCPLPFGWKNSDGAYCSETSGSLRRKISAAYGNTSHEPENEFGERPRETRNAARPVREPCQRVTHTMVASGDQLVMLRTFVWRIHKRTRGNGCYVRCLWRRSFRCCDVSWP